MARFEVVSKYKNEHDIDLIPKRGTKFSAGYDMVAAEDMVIPPAEQIQYQLSMQNLRAPLSLDELKAVTKGMHWQTSLIPTGVKCKLADDEYLKLTSRSSVSLNDWLICANSQGIIDCDYYNNQDNEGHIYFQVINLSPYPIQIHKGNRICQGIIQKYYTVEDDQFMAEERTGGFGSTGTN